MKRASARLLQGLMAALLAAGAAAQGAKDMKPDELVRTVTEEVIAAVKSDKQLAAGDKEKALKLAEEKVLPHIDFGEAARLAVGRAWSKASKAQQEQIVTEFRRMLVRTYSNAITAYEGQTMKVLPARYKPDDTDVTVRNQFLSPGRPPVQIDYSMHKTDEGWKIYDIVVEGVSLVVTYRSEFDALVKQDGIDGLIKRLQQKNAPSPVGGSGK